MTVLRMRRVAARTILTKFGAAALLSACLGAGPAFAQDPFGMLEAHGAMSAQAQYAAQLHAAYSNDDDDDDRPTRGPPPPNWSPERRAELEAEGQRLAEEEAAEEAAGLQRWREGFWDFFQSREPAAPGEYCSAMYQNPQGIITLSGVDESWDGALLMFTGENIPKPRNFREITATLTQTGEAPATVRVFNYARDPRMGQFGTLVFAVPGMDAALAGMSDEQEFALSVGGREVFRMSWKGGVNAATELRKCLRNR